MYTKCYVYHKSIWLMYSIMIKSKISFQLRCSLRVLPNHNSFKEPSSLFVLKQI